MTRDAFIKRAVLAAERAIRVHPGWWGNYRDVCGPTATGKHVRVRFSGGVWVIGVARFGFRGQHAPLSRHDSRTFAIAKARKL